MFENTRLYKYAENLQHIDTKQTFKNVLNNRFIIDLITYLNTDEQLGKERTDSLGRRLGFYSERTQVISKGRKKLGEPFDLNDTGAFWDSWKVEVKKDYIKLDANPFKEDTNLFEKYGIDILGLTDKNLQALINEAQKLYIEYYGKYIYNY